MELPKRKTNRLNDYDYTKVGYYFVTICIENKIERFIRNEKSLKNIRDYIINNPINWSIDIENVRINREIDSYYERLYVK